MTTTEPKTREAILASLSWSAPREVPTKKGPRMVSSAPVNDEVLALWGRERSEMYGLGYSVSEFRGKWQISRWTEIDAKVVALREESKALSRATDAEIAVPCPAGLAYLGYQKAGIKFGLDRPAVLIGDEMGLGKTIQAIGILNALPEKARVLIICPASLKLNWQRELKRWLVTDRSVLVADSKTGAELIGALSITIMNYDILHKFWRTLRAREWDVLIADEAHYLKTPDSRRTQMVFGRKAKKATTKREALEAVPPVHAKKRILLTGTPISNRPVELFPLIEYLDPVRWTNFFKYANRYCDAHNNGFGWDFTGSSNLEELQDILRTSIMVRRLKKDVLTELPAKRRQVIEFPAEGKLAQFVADESEAYGDHEEELSELHAQVELAKASDNPDDYTKAVENLRKGVAAVFAGMSTSRRLLAEAKIDLCIEHIREAVEEAQKVVVFAHHKSVAAAIAAAFGNAAVTLVGDTPMVERQAAVDRFQRDPSCKVFVGSIGAAGVGITLTAASHVIFCELSWVPGEVSQGEDRCHRIGQRESVLVQHLVVEGSLDATMAKRIVAKQEVIDQALDTLRAPMLEMPVASTARGSATVGSSKEKIAKEAELMTPDERAAAHEALKFLAGRCNGARDWDGAGFSKIDTCLGKDLAARTWLSPKQAALARKIAWRYRKSQLPESLVARLGVAA